MRSGRGKCPQCKETIVVDLDAAEIRCPYCNALLKKSKKTVAEVRAEEEARIAAAEARERALRGEPEVPVQPEPEPVAETPAEPVPEVPAEPVVEAPAEPEVPAEEVAEAAAEEPVDEIGMTDEELAALDDALPTDEETPAAEPVDEIGLSDEELAAMDDAPAIEESEEAVAEEVPAETVAEAPAEEAVDADIPTEEAADVDIPVEETAAEEAPVEEAPIEETPAEEVPIEETPAEDVAAIDDIPATEEGAAAAPYIPSEEVAEEDETPVEEPAAEEPAAEEPAEEVPVEEPAEEVTTEDAEPAEEETPAAADEEPEAVEPEEVAPAEIEPEEEPAVEEPAAESAEEEVPAAAEPAADETAEAVSDYTDEDMAFAASLSDGLDAGDKGGKKGGYVAPIVDKDKSAKTRGDKDEASADKSDASKGEKKMSDSAIYKKPVAVIMMILAIIGAAIALLFKNVQLFSQINADLGGKVADVASKLVDALPKGAAMIPVILGGVAILISILGLTGRCGKVAFIFALLSGLVYTANALVGGIDPIVKIEAVADLLAKYGDYVGYAVYGLLFIAAFSFLISIVSGKEEFEISGATAILPILYILVSVGAYAALVILPFVTSFELTADYIKYAIFGIVGLSILLTLIGVHRNTTSRGANAWLLFAAAAIVALLYAADVALDMIVTSKGGMLSAQVRGIVTTVIPCILFFPLIGYTISDLRN